MGDQERRRETAIVALTIKYLEYVDRHHFDEGFDAVVGMELEQLRRATRDIRLVIHAGDGLRLSDDGRRMLQGQG